MPIKIYTTPTCSYCQQLKTWLKKKKLSFEEINVVEKENEKLREEMIRKTSQMAVPVTEIGDEIIVGFDEKKLEEALEKEKENNEEKKE